MPFITSIGIAVPENKFEQSTIARFMELLIDDEAEQRKMRAVFRASAINNRYSVLKDYGIESGFSFYPNSKGLEPFPSTAQRMAAYRQHACELSLKAIGNCVSNEKVQEITHLITVSCTGMYAPGLDIDIVDNLRLPLSTERICINFMGCYAAINALKVANSISLANYDAKVLVVCTELCSLHFQKKFSEDNILANALFADGSAALLIESHRSTDVNFSLENFHSDIVKSKEQHMAWEIGNVGFEMKLSSYVPQILTEGIHHLLDALTRKSKIEMSHIHHFAIHPGGKKILEAIEAELNLSSDALRDSYQILREYGNMSSPTIVFVLNTMKKKFSSKNHGELIMGMAFGPGLTIESALFKVHAS